MDQLLPDLDFYYRNKMNILLIGLHGVGKSQSLREFAEQKNINMKYFSCATLDPYTDFVGIPTPRKHCLQCNYYSLSSEVYCQNCKATLERETLRMIRPDSIDDAELIVFDEMNRCQDKLLNAIFELIQFRAINGEQLPNLKAVWGAVNPPNGDYQVNDLDPALLDRFHAFIEVPPRISYEYLMGRCQISKRMALALASWWKDIDFKQRGIDNFVSPRRMEMIGHILAADGDITHVFPPSQDLDHVKLNLLIEKVRTEEKINAKVSKGRRNIGDGPYEDFEYSLAWFNDQTNLKTAITYLRDNPEDFETHKEIIKVAEEGGAPELIKMSPVLAYLSPPILEGILVHIRSQFPSINAYESKADPNFVKKIRAFYYDDKSD